MKAPRITASSATGRCSTRGCSTGSTSSLHPLGSSPRQRRRRQPDVRRALNYPVRKVAMRPRATTCCVPDGSRGLCGKGLV
jgi:hypothetical protein